MKNSLLAGISFSFAIALFSCKSQSPTNRTSSMELKNDSTGRSQDSSSDQNQAILEKYWKLVELYGNPVVVDSTFIKEPHIIFKKQDNRIIGSGGCNNITGSYELAADGSISVPQPIATRMACPNMEIENKFLEALQMADNYTVNEDMLVLNKARVAPLARFKVVYMK